MIKKSNIFAVLIILLLIEVSVIFNNSMINIRLKEADYYLYKVALNQFTDNTFIITSKYNLIKKRITSSEHSLDYFGMEGQVQAILAEDQSNIPLNEYKSLPKYHPVNIVLKSLRTILGKEQLELPDNEIGLSKYLEISYFLERNRLYKNALENYNVILSENFLSPKIKASVLLHKAFCLSMLGNLEEAISIYDEIYNENPNSESGILAGKLISFLNELVKNNRTLVASSKNNFHIGRQLYLNMNYNKAIELLDLEIKRGDIKNRAEAYYYKGRAHEEMGQIKLAIRTYRKIMNLGRDTRWSKASNRRLIILGDIYKQEHNFIKEAGENLKVLKDTQFLKDITDVSKLINISENEKTLRSDFFVEESIFDDSVLNITEIQEEPKPKKKPKRRKLTKNKIKTQKKKKHVLTEAEKIEMKRKLANHKYRKSSFLKETIDKKTINLQKIYTKYINSGIVISGQITVSMQIYSSGKINVSILKSNIKNSKFKKEILKEINKWRFHALEEDLGVLTISYPFNFKQ